MNPTTRDSLEEYDEEVGLINIEDSNKCCKWCSKVIYTFIMITLSVSFLLVLYYNLILYVTNTDKIVDCSNGPLYLCGILVCPFIVLFTALNEFIDILKKY
jgi:hypothetical protein